MLNIVLAFALPPVSAWFWWGLSNVLRLGRRYSFLRGWLITAAVGIAMSFFGPQPGWFAGSAASFLVAAWLWWRKRRGRRRAPRAFGAKSRARVAALARRAREAARPRPVFRPVPSPA